MPNVFPLHHTYAALPSKFYAIQQAAVVEQPELLMVNQGLVEALGIQDRINEFGVAELAQWLSGQVVGDQSGQHSNPSDNSVESVAMAYAGHQFGSFNPCLGDGRALLLGEIEASDQQFYDLHLKGSGVTPFSRQGDGKATLGAVMREYLISEAIHYLNIPSSRSLAIVLTHQPVYRQEPLPGAVLARVAKSLIRVGSFEYFSARGDIEALQQLVAFTVNRCFPELQESDNLNNLPLQLLEKVVQKQAELIAGWLSVGFIHGVMNTDNMAISGETIDYGPCAFMDTYRRQQVYSSIDHRGRYAYYRQKQIGYWNLCCFANCLLPLIDSNIERAKEQAVTILENYDAVFNTAWLEKMGNKLGLQAKPNDQALIDDFLNLLQHCGADSTKKLDFTNSFWQLQWLLEPSSANSLAPQMQPWLESWRQRIQQEPSIADVQQRLQRSNPAFIARNHQVQQAIDCAEQEGDFSHFYRLLQVLQNPFQWDEQMADLAEPPEPHEIVQQTYCGT